MAGSHEVKSNPLLKSNSSADASIPAVVSIGNIGFGDFPPLPSLGVNGVPNPNPISDSELNQSLVLNQSQQRLSYAGCLGNNKETPSTKLSFAEAKDINGVITAVFNSGELKTHLSNCEAYVVGYFVGKKLQFPFVKENLIAQWKLKGDFSMTLHGKHAFLFKFAQEEDRIKVLELGSVFIAQKLFLIRPWSIDLEKNIDAITSVPVWMNLRQVPLYLWNELGLSRIASIVGTPIMTDTPTALKTRMSYARVLVEVAADCEFPEELPILMDDVKLVVRAEYPWKPDACSHCKTFGHSDAKCGLIAKNIENSLPVNPTLDNTEVVAHQTELTGNTRDRTEAEQTPMVVETQVTKEVTNGRQLTDVLIAAQSEEVTGETVQTVEMESRISNPTDANWQNPKKKKMGKQGDKTVEATNVLNTYSILNSELPFANLCEEECVIEKSKEHENDVPVKSLTVIDKISGLLGDTSGKETSIFCGINEKYQKSWKDRELGKLGWKDEPNIDKLGRGQRKSAKKKIASG